MPDERMLPVSEEELVLPTLLILSREPYLADGVTMRELQPMLRELVAPSGKDLEIIKNRKDDYFSQKVRNLVSHRKLEKMGLAKYIKIFGQGKYVITDKGKYIASKYRCYVNDEEARLYERQMLLPVGQLLHKL